jgi:PAS domain S-box-containing protein
VLSSSLPDVQALASVLRSLTEVIIVTDGEGIITYVNPAAEKLFSSEGGAASTLSQPLRPEMIHPELGNRLKQAITEKASGPLSFELELGEEQPFSVSLTPMRDLGLAPEGWVIVLHDIGHLKKSAQWKREAFRATAHDMRNLLNMFSGAVGLLRNSLRRPTPAQKEYLGMLKSGAENLTMLIEQLANLERIEADADLKLVKLGLSKIAERVLEDLKPLAQEKGITLEWESIPTAEQVMGDETWLRRVAVSLVSNAIKCTPEGERVRVRYREADEQAIMEVSDAGPGIPASAQPHLFEGFRRVRGAPGSGLGLMVVRTIIERHAGRVWVSSEEGKGSTFGFSVPLSK